jgi:hypothetical protein
MTLRSHTPYTCVCNLTHGSLLGNSLRFNSNVQTRVRLRMGVTRSLAQRATRLSAVVGAYESRRSIHADRVADRGFKKLAQTWDATRRELFQARAFLRMLFVHPMHSYQSNEQTRQPTECVLCCVVLCCVVYFCSQTNYY